MIVNFNEKLQSFYPKLKQKGEDQKKFTQVFVKDDVQLQSIMGANSFQRGDWEPKDSNSFDIIVVDQTNVLELKEGDLIIQEH